MFVILLPFCSLIERARYVAVTPANISEIAAAVLTDVKLATYTSAKLGGHRERYFVRRLSRSLFCCFVQICAVERLSHFIGRETRETHSRSSTIQHPSSAEIRNNDAETRDTCAEGGFSARSLVGIEGSVSCVSGRSVRKAIEKKRFSDCA